MPIEWRRVGQYADGIIIDLQLAFQRLDHQRLPAGIADDQVNGPRATQSGHHRVAKHDVPDPGTHVLDRGAGAKHPIAKLMRGHGVGGIRRLGRHVVIRGPAGEIENAEIKPLLVDAVHDYVVAERIGAGKAVLRGVFDARATVLKRPRHLCACREDEHVRFKIKAEFHRPTAHHRPVLRGDHQSCAHTVLRSVIDFKPGGEIASQAGHATASPSLRTEWMTVQLSSAGNASSCPTRRRFPEYGFCYIPSLIVVSAT